MNSQTRKWEIVGKSKKQIVKSKDIIKILLENRGIKTEKEKKEFLEPIPPEEITVKSLSLSENEINKAIKRIKQAKKKKEQVIVYGDYDADGICATAIMWEALYALGLDVMPYIPERFSEGYGLNVDSISKLKSQNSKLGLIITVDHGIVADKKVDYAKELGIDVIITDHHEPGKVRPKPFALIHTQKIGGAGIAWILSREILRKIPDTKYQIQSSLELAAIGTIADQLPLIGPNRSIAKYGLEALNKTKRVGLLELFKISGIKSEQVGPYEVGFLIAPRINAMGRLEHAMESLRLLCTKNTTRAKELAEHLNKTNLERQKIVDEVVLHARNLALSDSRREIIVLAHESYHEGVIGLAAGKLVEEFYRPAIVLSKKKDISKASARSISGFNIIEAIRSLESLYIEGGGHPMAAGFSIKTELIGEFEEKINKFAKPLLTEDILTKKLKIDMELPFTSLDMNLVEKLKDLEPSGLGNPTPTFATKGVEVIDAKVVGRDNSHLKLKLRPASPEGGQGGLDSVVLSGIAFGFGELLPEFTPGKRASGPGGPMARRVDIAYQIEEDTWNGNQNLQLKIKDIKLRN